MDAPLRWDKGKVRAVVPFSRIPLPSIEALRWEEVAWGRWLHKDHITLGEGRATLKLLHIVASFAEAHDHILLSLEDNLALQGSWSKGRSPSGPLNFILRRRAATCIAARITMLLPWVQSPAMPADELSRRQHAAHQGGP